MWPEISEDVERYDSYLVVGKSLSTEKESKLIYSGGWASRTAFDERLDNLSRENRILFQTFGDITDKEVEDSFNSLDKLKSPSYEGLETIITKLKDIVKQRKC